MQSDLTQQGVYVGEADENIREVGSDPLLRYGKKSDTMERYIN